MLGAVVAGQWDRGRKAWDPDLGNDRIAINGRTVHVEVCAKRWGAVVVIPDGSGVGVWWGTAGVGIQILGLRPRTGVQTVLQVCVRGLQASSQAATQRLQSVEQDHTHILATGAPLDRGPTECAPPPPAA